MKLWTRSTALALTAALTASSFLWEASIAKELCEDGGSDPVVTPAPVPDVCGTRLENVYIHGPDLKVVVDADLTAVACCDICTGTSGCKAYTFTQAQTVKTCFVKSAAGDQTTHPGDGEFNVVSAIVRTSPTPVPTTPVPRPVPTPISPTPAPTSPTPAVPNPAPVPSTPTSPAPSETPVPISPGPTPPPTDPSPTPVPSTPSSPTPLPSTPTPSETPVPSPVPTPTKTPVPTSTKTPVPTPSETPVPTPPSTPPAPISPVPAPSPALGCAKQLKNIYYHGFDIAESTLDTPEECCAACSSDPRCKLYTHFKSSLTGEKRCLLKSAAGEKTNYADSKTITAVSAFVNLPPTPEPTPEPTPAPTPALGCSQLLKNIYYHGFDLLEFALDTPEECCQACSDDPRCVLYTLFKSSTTGAKRCLLKSAAGEKTNYGDSPSVTVVSAFVNRPPTPAPTPAPVCTIANGQYCGNSQGVLCCDSSSYCQPWNNDYYQCIGLPDGCGELEPDTDYYGSDIGSVSNIYPWECCQKCQETAGCMVYTFVNLDPSGSTCYMKSSAAGKMRKVGALSGRRLNFSPLPTPEPSPKPTPAPASPSPVPTPSTNSSCGALLKNIYFHGREIKELALSAAEECCGECAKTPGCVVYTLFKSSATGVSRCLLKYEAGEKTNYGDSKTVTAVSAYAKFPLPTPTTAPQEG